MALNIKQAIKNYGLTSKEVAERLGMTAVNLSYHINGNPSVEILERIAKAIGCDIVELFDPLKPTIECPHCQKKIALDVKVTPEKVEIKPSAEQPELFNEEKEAEHEQV